MATTSREAKVAALLRSTELKPIDYSILDQFEFVSDPGNYPERQVCIMTALHLVTEIAIGNTTLEKAIMSDEEWRQLAVADRRKQPKIRENDKVLCVSDVIRDLAIGRNDMMYGEAERKAWAIRTMPKLLGTYLGVKFENHLRQLDLAFDLRAWLADQKILVERARQAAGPRTKEGKALKNKLSDIESKLSEIVITAEDFEGSLELDLLDARIEYLSGAARVEREKRDRENEARRAARAAQPNPQQA